MYYFIINPGARSGTSLESWKRIKYELEAYNIEFQAIYTKYAGHAGKLAAQLTSDDTKRTIIVLGGDGTLNEVVSGMQRFDTITLGYIPIGSSNDFGRGINATAHPIAAIRRIMYPQEITHMDIGKVKHGNDELNFLVSCGIGYDAAICHEVAATPLKKILNFLHLGRLIYIAIGIKQLLKPDTTTLSISLDHAKEITYEHVLFASIQNLPYEGGGVKFCPYALPDDNALDICIVQCKHTLYGLFLLPFAMLGLHRHFPGIHLLRCKEARITTKEARPIHVDGEPVDQCNQLDISCVPNQLHVITK
ncbi:MAG: diacylglycerol/lipid kinase family protein [Lachnospiraceae bacterium]